MEHVKSCSDAAGTTVLNHVYYVYNAWGQVAREYQWHNLEITFGQNGNLDDTPLVGYDYDDGAAGGAAKYVRPTDVVYPNGRKVGYHYAAGVDDIMSRLSSIFDDADGDGLLDTGETLLAAYTYLGVPIPGTQYLLWIFG